MTNFKISFAIICSLIFGLFFLFGNYYFTLIFLLFTLFLFFLKIDAKFIILSFTAFFPFSVGSFVGKGIFAFEMITPLVFVFLLYVTLKGKYSLFPRGARFFLFVLVIFLTSVVFHYVAQPVSAEILGASSEYSRGLRDYYVIIIGVFIYFSSLWFFAYRNINEIPWLRAIIIISITLGLLRLLSYFLNFQLPFILGSFGYAEYPSTRFGGLTYRIGGLDTVSMIGFSAFAAYYHKRNISFFGILSFVLLFTILVLGGGRAAFWGLIFSFVIYTLFLNRKSFLRIVCLIFFILLIYVFSSTLLDMPNQFKRLFAISANIAEKDVYRGETFKLYWHLFTENPIIGKGIGFINVYTPYKEFVLQQLKAGGHCAYLSILAIFGIIGGIFLFTFLFGTILVGYRTLRKVSSFICSSTQENLIIFSLFYLVTASVYYLIGLSGYDDMVLFFTSGLVGGLTVKSLKNNAPDNTLGKNMVPLS